MKPTGLRALLPSLNDAEFKLLERWAAEQRIEIIQPFEYAFTEIIKHYPFMKPVFEPILGTVRADIATLKKEAEGV